MSNNASARKVGPRSLLLRDMLLLLMMLLLWCGEHKSAHAPYSFKEFHLTHTHT